MTVGNRYIIKQILNLFIKRGGFDSVSSYHNYLLVEHVWTGGGEGGQSLKSPSLVTFKQWIEQDGKNVNNNSLQFLLYWINKEMRKYFQNNENCIEATFKNFCDELLAFIKTSENNSQLLWNIEYLLMDGECENRIEDLLFAFSKYDLNVIDLSSIDEFNKNRKRVVTELVNNEKIHEKIEAKEEAVLSRMQQKSNQNKNDEQEVDLEKLNEAKEAIIKELEIKINKNGGTTKFSKNKRVLRLIFIAFLLIGIAYIMFNNNKTKTSISYNKTPQQATPIVGKRNESLATTTPQPIQNIPTETPINTDESIETEVMEKPMTTPTPIVIKKRKHIESKNTITHVPTVKPDKTPSTSNKHINTKLINKPIKQIAKIKKDKENVKKTEMIAKTKAKQTIKVGNYVLFGKYHDKPILWKCISKKNGTMLISQYILRKCSVFDASESGIYEKTGGTYTDDVSRQKYGSNDWGNSNLREWLNSGDGKVKYSTQPPIKTAVYENEKITILDEPGFLTGFSKMERSGIKAIKHNEKQDLVYLLSIDEAVEYFGYPDKGRIKRLKSGEAWFYWLRSSYSEDGNRCRVDNVSFNGFLGDVDACEYFPGILPALNLKSDFAKSGKGTISDPFKVIQ